MAQKSQSKTLRIKKIPKLLTTTLILIFGTISILLAMYSMQTCFFDRGSIKPSTKVNRTFSGSKSQSSIFQKTFTLAIFSISMNFFSSWCKFTRSKLINFGVTFTVTLHPAQVSFRESTLGLSMTEIRSWLSKWDILFGAASTTTMSLQPGCKLRDVGSTLKMFVWFLIAKLTSHGSKDWLARFSLVLDGIALPELEKTHVLVNSLKH